ncbi:MAG: S-adenosyl-l-methionine hydroxide adenosyltransferase family protein [Thermoplasmatales archaeon]|nr:S-adenosyl-l-methionine hydroxide adenosyltransferase family protein [Thermoplasmatales archaeon]
MKMITFLSDFGSKSSYVPQMKGVAHSMTDAKTVDITHDITPHNIREGAFVLRNSVPYFPVGTVHVAVVDPGVGTTRRGIVVATRTQILVGPDNGLLIPTARYLGDFNVYEIVNTDLMLNSISNTFHGRDIFTPVATHILNGVPFDQIGPIVIDFVDLDFGKFEIKDKAVTGKVIYIDNFGNIITNIESISLNQVLSYDNKIMAFIGDKQLKIPFVMTYDLVKKGDFLATIGSSNLLEIAQNQGNAAKKLGIKTDDEIKILLP